MLDKHVALYVAASTLVSSMARVSARAQSDNQADSMTEADDTIFSGQQLTQDPTATTTISTNENVSSGSGITPWAIAIVVILILLIAVCILLLVLRKRGRTPTVVPSVNDDGKIVPSVPSVPSVIAQPTSAVPELHYNEKVRPPSGELSDEGFKREEFKIALPMPPKSTSLFSDKLELSSEEAAELYKQYMNQKDDFCSVDIDQPQQQSDHWHHRLSTGMAKRATTIRSTIRQSMRRQRSTNKSQSSTAPLHEIFDDTPKKNYAPSMNSAYTEKIAMDDFYQNEALKEKSLPEIPSVPTSNVLPAPTQALDPVATHSPLQSTMIDVVAPHLDKAVPAAVSAATEFGPYSPLQENQCPSALVEETASHTAAHRIIMDASVRSKHRSILPISCHEDFGDHEQQQRKQDIMDWWQNESMVESDCDNSKDGSSSLASSPSMLTKALQQQHDIMTRENSNVQLSSVSRQSSLSRVDHPGSIVSGRSPPSFMQLSRQNSILSGIDLVRQNTMITSTPSTVRSQKPSLHAATSASMREPSVAESKRNSTVSSVRPSLESMTHYEPSSAKRNSILELFRRSSQLQSNQSSIASRQSTTSRPHVTPSNLMSLSWRAQQQRQLASEDDRSHEEPVPTVSFSSSTVQTMIPENEYEQVAAGRPNAVKNRPAPKKKQTPPKKETTKKLNAKKAATASAATGKPTTNDREGISTLHGGRRQSRASIPWMQQAEKGGKPKKTPAQRERDRYLQSLNK
ncbi:hypothetical protein BCR43DRAFT_520093 [Syncephalastrum racemosum]|uniref:Uncharacterized protein n=1 Tax=Syncephalastrum racemosum TaxID=13706 RepID=A0A1X2HTC2_SYNRA|nr:hypothetical protein BCR43DRAFT_520093 [Syncephalastrum racemosum]